MMLEGMPLLAPKTTTLYSYRQITRKDWHPEHIE